MKNISRNLIILHATVIIWGFTGILGALISINATQLVWYRVLIAFLALWIYFKLTRRSFAVNRKTLIQLLLIGGLVATHWVLFFLSIKLSTVSVALVCLSSLTLFTSVLEPLINRKKFSSVDVLMGLVMIFGIYMIFKFESRYTLGIIAGLSCALFASLFSILNARQVKERAAPVIAFYELIGGWIWVSLYLLLTGGFNEQMALNLSDTLYLLILGIVCTSGAYVAGVAVMKEFSAFKVALITNLEPVYGILLAFIFFGKREQMTFGFYVGASVVLAAIFLYPYIKTRIEHRKLNKQIPLG